MKRGDLVIVSLPGDYGKPRPALVIQSNNFPDHSSVTLLPITSHVVDAPLLRIEIGPREGVDRPSQIQVDKPHTIRRERIGGIIGQVDPTTMIGVNRALAVFLGLV
jgi:mRNA interferase MazF